MPPQIHVLHPGDVVCAVRGDRLETLLGSCISVILTDRYRSVACMCHIVHKDRQTPGDTARTTGAHAAIEAMYERLRTRAFNPLLCEAMVYGGGNMFPHIVPGQHVGAHNADLVLARLQADGIAVIQQDTGGQAYRRLRWTVGEGMPCISAVEVTPA